MLNKIRKLKNDDVFVKIVDGKLFQLLTEEDGFVKFVDWQRVRNPDQKFIDAVNEALQTNFDIHSFD